MLKSSSGQQPERPRQAVILAGGRGTRLAPISDLRPKPLIEFHGQPFIEYLLEMLSREGFERVVLLTGYRGRQLEAKLGSGAKWGLEIVYHWSQEKFDTGARVRAASNLLDDTFLLLYCDNYWPLPFEQLWTRYCAMEVEALVTVYRNSDDYTRSNLIVDGTGKVVLYDKTRSAKNLQGVDIGFLILRKHLLQLLPPGNVNLERELFPNLIAQGQLAAFVSEHRYYSVGDIPRLPATEKFLRFEPTILLDRDGVLNKKRPKGEYITDWREWEWQDHALSALRKLTRAGYRIVIITNQAGITRGMLDVGALEDIHSRMTADAEEFGAKIACVYYCPHGWDDGCDCRKPRPGMLLQAQKDFCLDLSRCWFLGDDERDGMAAKAAGCRFGLIDENTDLAGMVDQILALRANVVQFG
jgi:D-glycero-D-manno-heptose 1,7-bisphosphate phosphatase